MRYGLIPALTLLIAAAMLPAEPPATMPIVTPQADAMLAQIRDAYVKLPGLQIVGSTTSNFDADGNKQLDHVDFSADFSAPVSFRHEIKGDGLFVSNNEKAFVYNFAQKQFMQLRAPTTRSLASELPYPLNAKLPLMNPSLAAALIKDSTEIFLRDVTSADRGPDVSIDGKAYQSLDLSTRGQKLQLLIDPDTHLLRRETIDDRQELLSRGSKNVNSATIVIDYASTKIGPTTNPAVFDWTPPADAKPMEDAPEGAALAALVGKPAPQANGKLIDGSEVSLEKLHGNVVVLDFWATWCPPCIASLPRLDAMSKESASSGVKFFAVNAEDPADAIKAFAADHHLSLPMVIDADHTFVQAFAIENLPSTIVVGRDGLVKYTSSGFGPSSEAELHAAIASAIAQK